MTSIPPLRLLVFLGSVRDSAPPRPSRLGERVALASQAHLKDGGHQVTLVDPLSIDWPRPFKPHFAYAKGAAPADIDALAANIERADGYVMVSPEYNHSLSPALADCLNHFGSSLFSYKPSAIVTYSAGQWGGARAAVSMRTFLSELGCLPVSAMIHIPKAQTVLADGGGFAEDADGGAWHGYFGRTFDQLTWWASAARDMRSAANMGRPEAFRSHPSQRNAPQS